jgi:hypothetical protein
VAAAVMVPPAVWATLAPRRPRANAATALGVLFVVIVVGRARAFAARSQAVPLVLGAAAGFCCVVSRHLLSEPPGIALVWGALVLVVFAVAALVAALLVPVTSFTPSVRVAIEWLELVAIVVALPMAAWIGGLFTWVRMR